MANKINPQSQLPNVLYTVPPEMQEFVRRLIAEIQELRQHVNALETQAQK